MNVLRLLSTDQFNTAVFSLVAEAWSSICPRHFRVGKQRLRETRILAMDYLILLLAGACLGSLVKVTDQTFGAAAYTYTIIAVCKSKYSVSHFIRLSLNLLCWFIHTKILIGVRDTCFQRNLGYCFLLKQQTVFFFIQTKIYRGTISNMSDLSLVNLSGCQVK